MTKRSMDYLRKQGYVVAPTEQWISFPDRATGKTIKIRRDAFNFCDLIGCHPDHAGTLYVQTTTRVNQSSRRNKILLSPEAVVVLRSQNRIHVHGWAQVGARGRRKLWEVAIFEAKLESSGIHFYPIME